MQGSARHINMLSASAAELTRRGQLQDAERVYSEILQTAPYHIQALDFLAMRAFVKGDTGLSLELLERSMRAGPERALVLQNLGLVHKARGDYESALAALDRALKLQPVYPMALIHKGSVLELLDRRRDAVRAYLCAWKQAPGFQQMRNSDRVSEPVRELLSHSADIINQARIELLDLALADLRAKHGNTDLQRVTQFVELYLGTALPRYKHAMQRPAFLYFPELEARPFFEREEFDWVRELEAATAEIRGDLLAVLQQPDELQPYVHVNAPDPAQWKELNNSPQWSAFHFYKSGERHEAHCALCPVTTQVAEKLPLVRTSSHSPEVFFSILKPGTHIPPHYGLGNYKIAVHLPLIVPADCAIRVGNETRIWTEGKCLIFDDSFQHEAWNRSSELRAVLILEVWNPQLTPAERQAIAAVLSVIRDFEREYGTPVQEQVG